MSAIIFVCCAVLNWLSHFFLQVNRLMTRHQAISVAGLAATALNGCQGVQSALNPAGREAAQIAELFQWMLGGAIAVWLLMLSLLFYAVWLQPASHHRKQTTLWVIGGGAVFPTVVLTVLLLFGLRLLPQLLKPAPQGSLQVAVSGAQWWWRVRYLKPGPLQTQAFAETPAQAFSPIESANEIRLPAGEPVQFLLDTEDVIHAFWIPSLGGKIDMLPGRQTRLTLTPEQPGIYRGACAEYCGTAHAEMNFDVVVMPRPEFEEWLKGQSQPAVQSFGKLATRGQQLFASRGCAACHTIRGTPANGVIGPDLTHVSSRLSIGAGLLKKEHESFYRWLQSTEHIKPGVLMPEFDMLSHAETTALAAYLEELR